MITAREIRDLRTGLRDRAPSLRALGLHARAAVIEAACALLRDPRGDLGRALRSGLAHSTGLSAAGVEHGLRTTLGLFTRAELLALHGSRPPGPAPELATVVLAGNVFSAAARPLLLPLLCGCPVLLKASSADDVFPRALQRTLADADPALGAACAVVTFARDESALSAELIADADLLSVYGDDPTVAALAAMRSAGTRLIAHGHGLGLAFVAASTLQSAERVQAIADALARDVAAYDQRGCLSPHAVFVQAGAACDAGAFAERMADALGMLAASWPRGRFPVDAAAAQLQWRGAAAATSRLHVGDDCAVRFAADDALQASPGYRNVSVHACRDLAALQGVLSPLGAQLKALAVAGDAERAALGEAAPYVCAPGALQEPPLAARLDGLHPLAGL